MLLMDLCFLRELVEDSFYFFNFYFHKDSLHFKTGLLFLIFRDDEIFLLGSGVRGELIYWQIEYLVKATLH